MGCRRRSAASVVGCRPPCRPPGGRVFGASFAPIVWSVRRDTTSPGAPCPLLASTVLPWGREGFSAGRLVLRYRAARIPRVLQHASVFPAGAQAPAGWSGSRYGLTRCAIRARAPRTSMPRRGATAWAAGSPRAAWPKLHRRWACSTAHHSCRRLLATSAAAGHYAGGVRAPGRCGPAGAAGLRCRCADAAEGGPRHSATPARPPRAPPVFARRQLVRARLHLAQARVADREFGLRVGAQRLPSPVAGGTEFHFPRSCSTWTTSLHLSPTTCPPLPRHPAVPRKPSTCGGRACRCLWRPATGGRARRTCSAPGSWRKPTGGPAVPVSMVCPAPRRAGALASSHRTAAQPAAVPNALAPLSLVPPQARPTAAATGRWCGCWWQTPPAPRPPATMQPRTRATRCSSPSRAGCRSGRKPSSASATRSPRWPRWPAPPATSRACPSRVGPRLCGYQRSGAAQRAQRTTRSWSAAAAASSRPRALTARPAPAAPAPGPGAVVDRPRFGHRGVLLDTARNWFSIEDIKRKVIDPMHLTKLNVLVWCAAWGRVPACHACCLLLLAS